MASTSRNDDFDSRRNNVLKSIEEIREKKAEIARALRGMNRSSDDHAEEDKEFVKRLVESFDQLSTQENSYLDILNSIGEIQRRESS